MTNQEAQTLFKKYLRSHDLFYTQGGDGAADMITVCYSGYMNCPDHVLESSVWFYDDSMQVFVYFDSNASEWAKENAEKRSDVFRLLNFINAEVWPCISDGCGNELYSPSHLYTPRIYMTEDGCYDITLTTVIPYDFYELAPLETEDYITATCPELMDKLSPAIFQVLLGAFDREQGIAYIKEHVFDK